MHVPMPIKWHENKEPLYYTQCFEFDLVTRSFSRTSPSHAHSQSVS
jgi:hypothetical protein